MASICSGCSETTSSASLGLLTGGAEFQLETYATIMTSFQDTTLDCLFII
uniref:Uncharacterized protein n=1 Tax=Rhizophora mucronata TaxID=61149 RepID=A0A2P2Q710_RHIMU